jgi:WD40 repeat protein
MHDVTSCSTEHRPMPLLNTENYSNELWGYVSSRLEESRDLMALRATNRHLYDICLDTPQWEALLEKYFPSSLAKAFSPMDYPNVYREGALQWSLFRSLSSPCDAFTGYRKFRVHEGRLFADLLNGTVEISDIKSHEVIGSLRINSDSFSFFQVQGDFFCAAGNNRAEVWRVSTGKCIHKEDFIMNVDFFQMHVDFFCIGSKTGQVKVWNTRTGEQILELINDAIVKDFQLYGNFLFLGGIFQITEEESENVVKMWDIHKGCVVNTFEALPGSSLMKWMQYLKVEEGFLVVLAPALEEIGVWNANTAEFLHTIKHNGWFLRDASCDVQGNFFLALGPQETRIWDIRTGKLLHVLKNIKQYTPRFEVCGDFLIIFKRLYEQTTDALSTEVWNIPLGKRIGTLARQETLWSGLYSQTEGDFLCVESDQGILAWDLLPHPSAYGQAVLEDNLSILEQMAQNLDEWPALFEKLDPRIQWHLTRTELPCLERVQTIVYLELLLHAVHDQDKQRTCTLLGHLGSAGANISSLLLKKSASRREKIQAVEALLAQFYVTSS